jgi:hypothetical protein
VLDSTRILLLPFTSVGWRALDARALDAAGLLPTVETSSMRFEAQARSPNGQ